MAVTSKAKSKIRGVIKKEQQETGRTVGKEVLSKELKKYGENYDKLFSSGAVKTAIHQLGYHNVDEALLAVGYGKLDPDLVAEIVVPKDKYKKKTKPGHGVFQTMVSRVMPKQRSAISVGGEDDIMIRFGKCCDPLPGDQILGFVTRGRGVTVHKTDCYKVLEVDSERKVDVEWAKNGRAVRSVRIRIVSVDLPGILASISKLISVKGGNISHASVKTTADKKAINMFDVTISDTNQLYALMRSLEKLKGIISVERMKG